jgi:exopolysaccharide production protein ExoQ
MAISQNNVVSRPLGALPSWLVIGMLGGTAVLAALGFALLPNALLSSGAIFIVAVVTLFVLLLCWGLGSGIAGLAHAELLVYRITLVIWWFLLACEVIFDHTGDADNTYRGQFAIEAYGEGIVWVLAFTVLLVLLLRRPSFLAQLGTGSYKWAWLFTGVCLLSIAWSPGQLYAGAWGFKLLLVVFLLRMCTSTIRDLDGITSFLKVSFWAFAVLTIVPVVIAFSDPATAFDGVGGRLNANPDELSATAGSLLLLALTLHAIEKRKIYLLGSILATVIMFLALGKAGIGAGVMGALFFFLLQKKVVRSLGLLSGVAAVGLLIVSVTPLGNHLRGYQGAATLTGRTLIWTAGIDAVKQKPILGHGYLASYFFYKNENIEDYVALQGMHLHNGFLDVAYNNGLLGLALLVSIHWVILRNLFGTLRSLTTLRSREPTNKRAATAHLLTIGLLATYINLFVAGLFNSSYGGRTMSPYMLFLALFMIACQLPRLISEMTRGTLNHGNQTDADRPALALSLEPARY